MRAATAGNSTQMSHINLADVILIHGLLYALFHPRKNLAPWSSIALKETKSFHVNINLQQNPTPSMSNLEWS